VRGRDLFPKSGRWATEETKRLSELVAAGCGRDEIAALLGRTPGAIEARLRWLQLSETARLRSNAGKVVREAKIRAGELERRNYVHNTRGSPRVPEQLAADREARYSAPLSISGFVLGDPPAGYSALDRKHPTPAEPKVGDTSPTYLPIGAPSRKQG
jgi:hypothetical protein